MGLKLVHYLLLLLSSIIIFSILIFTSSITTTEPSTITTTTPIPITDFSDDACQAIKVSLEVAEGVVDFPLFLSETTSRQCISGVEFVARQLRRSLELCYMTGPGEGGWKKTVRGWMAKAVGALDSCGRRSMENVDPFKHVAKLSRDVLALVDS